MLPSRRMDLKKAENEVALQCHSLYYGILIAKLQKEAAEQQTRYADEYLRESEDDVRNGNALKVTAIQGRATVLESQRSALTADLQLVDLTTELNDLLGLSARHSARSRPCGAGGILSSIHAKSTYRLPGPRIRRSRLPKIP